MIDSPIQPLSAIPGTTGTGSKTVSEAVSGEASFGSLLERSIDSVNRMQQEADSRAAQLASGESKDIHNTMIAMQKADIGMSLIMEVRNKVISAYDEIKRMQF
jgi:flagellar hook-basal body complex protein FliE